MNFLKRWFFLFCNDLIFFFSILFYLIGCLSVQVEPVLKRPIWEATSIPHSTFFVQKCPNVRHSFRYVWIYFFHSFIMFKEGIFWFYCLFFFFFKNSKCWQQQCCDPIFCKLQHDDIVVLFHEKIRYDNNGAFILLPGSGFLPRSGIWFSKSSAIRSSWIVHRGNKLVQCWSLYSNCSVSLSIFKVILLLYWSFYSFLVWHI